MLKSTAKVVQKGAAAIFLGTRRTDPYSGHLKEFSPSDHDKGWPRFVRVLPILDFSYAQIWDFMKSFEITYCPLYDLGYTYLGDKLDSIPNPFSVKADGSHLPAFESCENYEPFSRISQFKKLELNSQGNFIVTSENIGAVVIRTKEDVDPLKTIEQTGDVIEVAFSYLLQQSNNLTLKLTIEDIVENCENMFLITEDFKNAQEQNLRLEKIQRELIIERANNRIPLYIVYIDIVDKGCLIYE